jgi:predicted DNA binding CopG/RHH family protein
MNKAVKIPTVGNFLDEEERELYEAIESDDYVVPPSSLTPERKAELQQAARNTLNGGERVQITLRVSKYNLLKLKARAMREGMPYQTLINSILHKAVN